LLWEDRGGAIDDFARTVEGSAEDLFGDGGTEDVAGEFGCGVTVVNACRRGREREKRVRPVSACCIHQGK